MVAHLPLVGLKGAFDVVFITDVIAICVLVGTVLVPRVGMLGRAALGVCLYAASTFALVYWVPAQGSVAQLVRELLVGDLRDAKSSVFLYSFPIAQWLAVYLIATALGERLARVRAAGASSGIPSLFGLGGLLVAGGLLLWKLRPALERLPFLAGAGNRVELLFFTSPWQKLPPGADFLLCYLGLGLLLVSTCLSLERWKPQVLEPFALIGRNSLVVFVAQFFVFYSLIFTLKLPFTPFWPLLFIGSCLALFCFAVFWERADGQRVLTVGYPRFAAWAGRWRAAHAEAKTHQTES
jgi:hypothetical protein